MISPCSRVARRKGMALVIVLAFVVLLSGLVLAYISHSMLTRKMSDSSLGDTRARQLAESSLEVIVSDLKQEIANGSTTNTYGTNTLYLPSSNAFIVPMRSGNPAVSGTNDPIPNLIRRSVRSDSIASPGVASRASAVNSATDPSRNGRFVSPARWNKHYLIPRSDKGTNVDSTPNASANFTAPDWVYVTTNGPVVLTAPSTSVIGRYAYAIYDEGGLLDMNVAGFSSATPDFQAPHGSPNPLGLASWGSALKGSVAFADLTALKDSSGNALLSKQQIDQIVGWRNYATARPSGSFGSFTFDADSALRHHDFVRGNTNGFLSVSTNVWASSGQSATDQAFTSRQLLLKLRRSIGFSQDALQYMGTFSRDLEQPGFSPNPNRPKVLSRADVNNATYGTGNDAYGYDRESDSADDINPPFPKVRVTTPFVRADGSTAKVGEPLMKKRFPLSRLGDVLRTATASKSDSDPIYRNFGIYRSSTSQPWQYDHGDSTGILRLHEVAAKGREPDFFEILKAAINVGSIGKGSRLADINGQLLDASNIEQSRDTSTALQILQIGANIIDQYDSDGYPTRIAFSGSSGNEVRGVESLPYLNRIRMRFVRSENVAASGSTAASYPGCYVMTPELWNPHGSDVPSDAPTEFRFRAENALGSSAPSSMKLVDASAATLDTINIDWSTKGETTFRSNGTLFREPTVLANDGVPSGASLSGPSRIDKWNNTRVVGIGVDFECQYGTTAVDNVFMGNPGNAPVKAILEYRDGGAYHTYDEQVVQWNNSKFTPKNANGDWTTYTMKTKYDGFFRTDPRTSRWGGIDTEMFYSYTPDNLAGLVFPTQWPSLSIPPFAGKFMQPSDNGFVNKISSYNTSETAPQIQNRHRGFMAGYSSQNTVRNQLGFYGVASVPYYNRDPDGIARRAMGGYSSDPAAGGSTSNASGMPLVTGNKASRPIVLNRPFNSVAELGLVFRDTPWKNLDISFPESGDAALLDAFCLTEPGSDDALTAGRVSLNTRQAPVIASVLSGALVDELSTTNPGTLNQAVAKGISEQLIKRTTDPALGPIKSRAELVGRWKGSGAQPNTAPAADPDATHTGFSSDISSVSGVTGTDLAFITAQRDSAIRALSDVGTTRVWNLLIDVIAQTGKFAPGQTSLGGFYVEGEKRYWLHIAIDRLTGEILDKQLEVVTE